MPKLCVNCKFFTNSINTDSKHGKCKLFPTEENDLHFLITGVKYEDDYLYCSSARRYDNMCGKEASKYKKIPKKKSLINISDTNPPIYDITPENVFLWKLK